LKDRLVDMEYRGTGRVRLSEFYSGAKDVAWPFTESVEYLRALGALDESELGRPSVIIPNFVSSRNNCVFPSSFYSICCLDECEHLVSSLERAIESPDAAPARIAEVISALPSDTVDAPRNLSLTQLRRLEEIATLHEGQVPLHGRLFAQWMHHAYPRECPFPHEAGTTNPLSPNEWIAGSGNTDVSDSEIEMYIANADDGHIAMTSETKAEMPWISVEELVVSRRPDQGTKAPSRSALRVVALVAFCASVLRATFPSLSSGLAWPHQNKKVEHLV